MKSLATEYVIVREEIEISQTITSFKGLTGGWSKWGGGKKTVAINQFDRVYDEWNCQSCGFKQPKEITPYLIEWPEGEYIRVCAICCADGIQSLKTRIDFTDK